MRGPAKTRWPRGAPKHVGHGAEVEAGQARVAGRVIQHEHASLLYDTVRGQLNGLKRAEINQRRATEPLGACGSQDTIEKELRACIPHQAFPLQLEIMMIGLDIEGLHRVRVLGKGRKYHHRHHAILLTI